MTSFTRDPRWSFIALLSLMGCGEVLGLTDGDAPCATDGDCSRGNICIAFQCQAPTGNSQSGASGKGGSDDDGGPRTGGAAGDDGSSSNGGSNTPGGTRGQGEGGTAGADDGTAGMGGKPDSDGGTNGAGGTAGSDGGSAGMVGSGGGEPCAPYRCFPPQVLKASNADEGDDFGLGVAVEGDVIIVTAQDEDSNDTGVTSPELPAGTVPESGAAYAFAFAKSTWSQKYFLKAPIEAPKIHFGFDVALELPWAAVSSIADEGGSVHFFERSVKGVWTAGKSIKGSNTEFGDDFGRVVALQGNTIVVSAWNEDGSGTGIDPQSDNLATNAGAVYVFERSDGEWGETAYLKASNTDVGDWFGNSLAYDAGTIAIGARHEDSAEQGTEGVGEDDGATDSGAVYVFERDGAGWVQTAYIKSSNSEAYDEFGMAVALSGDTLVVGARYEDGSNAADLSDNQAEDSGAVYVFTRSEHDWIQTAYLKASNLDGFDHFGSRVALSGNYLAVGATHEQSNGDKIDNSVEGAGAVYLFERVEGTWQEIDYFKAPNPGIRAEFGLDIALDAQTLVVGAVHAGTTVADSGAAYVFR